MQHSVTQKMFTSLTKGDDTHSNKLRQYYGTTFLRHNIARLS